MNTFKLFAFFYLKSCAQIIIVRIFDGVLVCVNMIMFRVKLKCLQWKVENLNCSDGRLVGYLCFKGYQCCILYVYICKNRTQAKTGKYKYISGTLLFRYERFY